MVKLINVERCLVHNLRVQKQWSSERIIIMLSKKISKFKL